MFLTETERLRPRVRHRSRTRHHHARRPVPTAAPVLSSSGVRQMNVSDKARLHRQARRVLALEGRLALWDVAAGPNQPPRCPGPWAGSAGLSHLATPGELRTLVTDAALEVIAGDDLT